MSKLDANQVLKESFDDSSKRLRVDAEVTATIGTVDVIIDATTDNIAISDGTDTLSINPDGSINVQATDLDIRNLDAGSDDVTAWMVDEAGNAFSNANPLPISATVLPLPSGAATEAKQDTGNTSLASIDNKLIAENARQLVLNAADLLDVFTWLDFGTSTQRIDSVVYTSATYPSYTVTKTFSYTLVIDKYRLDNISWSVS